MSKKRVVLLVAMLLAAVGGLKYNEMRAERARQAQEALAKAIALPPKPVRNWRWAGEPEWVVHQVVREMVSWSLHETAAAPTLAVRRKPDSKGPGIFDTSLVGGTGARAIVVSPQTHVWDPAAYVEAAAEILGAGPGESGAPVPGVSELLLSSDTASLVKADGLLFAALIARPRDARLHEQAALLWAAHAMRNSATWRMNPRPFLNGVAAHLAMARALSPGTAPGTDAEIAGIGIDVVVMRQTDAMQRIDALAKGADADATRAWTNALRVRVTLDPRRESNRPPRTRIEKLEYLNAIFRSQQFCSVIAPTAAAWGLRRSADWARDSLSCVDEEYLAALGDPLELQALDAMELAGVQGESAEEGIKGLADISRAGTHQPGRPSAVVPVELRAEAGLRHVGHAYQAIYAGVLSKSLEGAAKRFSEWAAPLRSLLPEAPLLELAQDRADTDPARSLENRDYVRAPPDTCARVGKLLTDRPDLLLYNDWLRLQACIGDPSLKSVGRTGWDFVAVPGTGLITVGPWSVGAGEKEPEYETALARAPWAPSSLGLLLRRHAKDKLFPTTAELLAAYGRVLDYNTSIKSYVLNQADDPDLVERLAKQVCAADPDACGLAGWRLAESGRVEAALPLGARAVARARNAIALSQGVSWYVSALQERGRTAEAMRIAARMAEVYSAAGLTMLGKAYERMGQFKEAAETYRLITERYATSEVEDTFYVRHAQRYGPAPFEEETAAALGRLFPKGLRKISIEQAAQATRPLSLNFRGVLTNRLNALGLSHRDSFLAVDGFIVETPEQYGVVLTFVDEPNVVYLVKRKDGKVEEIRAETYRPHYGVVVKRRMATD